MKKRLLITSIVMMLVVAVALSTATYAWFTQNASVTANSVTMTAGVADAQSISIGWFGSELKSTNLTSATDSTALQPMCPVAAMTSSTTAASIAFNGGYVDTTGVFKTVDDTVVPYTWNNTTTQAFYINNDSNSQPVSISVAVDNIANSAALTALDNGTLLEGSGKVYYKKSGTTYTKLVAGTDYTANTTTVSSELLTSLSADGIYSTKGVEDYVRIAVFATVATSTPLDTLTPANYTYKGLLAKNAGENTVYGDITADTAASTLLKMTAATSGVEIIGNLPALNRVYVIVKVWLDGADFTQHENNQAASVSLTFSAGAAHN